VVKLVAFLGVGVFVTFGIYHGFGDVFAQAAARPELRSLFTMKDSSVDWAWLIFISMMAIMFLPRQFQMAVVENVSERHLNKAIWLFPLYLLAINIFVLPIALGGLLRFPGGAVDPDTFVLALPIAQGREGLALFVFIGGLSAATSMVIVATVALSTMLSNDLLMPVLLRLRVLRLAKSSDLSGLLLGIRRSAIVVLLLLSYAYFRLTGEDLTLVSIGLISFAAVAQFGPAILGGIYWKGGGRVGAIVGLTAGFLVWGYTLPLPSLVQSGWLSTDFIEKGPWGLSWLRPYELFGLHGLNPLTHAMVWSMLVNLGGYIVVSLLTLRNALEHSQATLFVDVFKLSSEGDRARFWRGSASVEALRSLLGRFLGPQRVAELFDEYAQQRGLNWTKATASDAELVDFAENKLDGTI
jgi:Na+/proline symporter